MLQAIAPSLRPRELLARIRGGVRGLVVGVPDNYFFDRLTPDVEQAVRAAIRKFEQLGARIESLRLPSMEDATELSRITLLAPVVVNRKGEHQKLLERLRHEGYSRVRINGEVLELEDREF